MIVPRGDFAPVGSFGVGFWYTRFRQTGYFRVFFVQESENTVQESIIRARLATA
jgi:hypothetical protein